jgi:hypothetical protein
MFGELKQDHIDQVLHAESIGRIGSYVDGRTYIVPVNYTYDGTYIYGRTIKGMKLQMMRANPEVCFQVDHIKNLSNWQSVIAWGTFEELKGEEAAKAILLLTQQLVTLIASGQSLHEITSNETHTDNPTPEQRITVYRIRLSEKTGRFETTT